jgi:hypothetical protein
VPPRVDQYTLKLFAISSPIKIPSETQQHILTNARLADSTAKAVFLWAAEPPPCIILSFRDFCI